MDEVKIFPKGERVLVKLDEVKDVTAGGLIIPSTAMNDTTPDIGTVIALGDESDFEFEVKVGDRVMLKKYASDVLTLDRVEYYIVDHEDILARMDDGTNN